MREFEFKVLVSTLSCYAGDRSSNRSGATLNYLFHFFLSSKANVVNSNRTQADFWVYTFGTIKITIKY